MHKYFDFKKIYEAENLGTPLSPEELGTPASSLNIADTDSSIEIEDFTKMSLDNILEITLTFQDIENLKEGQSVLKEDAEWKKKSNETHVTPIKLVIINTKNETSKNDPTALVFNLDEDTLTEILNNIDSQTVMQSLKGTGRDGIEIPNITVRFIKSIDLSVEHDKKVIPASPNQLSQAGEILPNESKRIFNFNQFINENKKKEIKDVKIKNGEPKKNFKKKVKFPDLSGDGKITKKDILIAKGVIKK